MKLTDKESLKILAEAIKDNCFQPVGIRYCRFCNRIVSKVNNNHDENCPALLAEEVLNRCPTCNGLKMIECHAGNGVFINTTCEQCNGTGVKK